MANPVFNPNASFQTIVASTGTFFLQAGSYFDRNLAYYGATLPSTAAAATPGPLKKTLFGARTFGMALPQLSGSSFAGYTWQAAMSIPGAFNAVRLIFCNTTTNALTIDGCSVGSSQSASSLNNVSGAGLSGLSTPWQAGTFGGSASGTLPANTFSNPNVNPNFYRSDWIPVESAVRTDGGSYGILLARAYIVDSGAVTIPASGTGTSPNFSEGGQGFLYKTAFQSGNFLTSTFTGATDPGCSPIVGAEFAASGAGVRIAHFGDSIDRGYVATVDGNGWGQRMAVSLNASMPFPVWYESYGWDAQSPVQYYTRWSNYLASAISNSSLPQIAIFKGWSTNGGTPSAQTTATDKYYLTRFIADCHANGIFPVICTGQPRNSLTSAQDLTRQNINAFIRSLASNTVGVIDVDAAVSDNGNPANYIIGLANADGIHPSDVGYANIAARAVSDITPLMNRFI
jgi:hypothetical protein